MNPLLSALLVAAALAVVISTAAAVVILRRTPALSEQDLPHLLTSFKRRIDEVQDHLIDYKIDYFDSLRSSGGAALDFRRRTTEDIDVLTLQLPRVESLVRQAWETREIIAKHAASRAKALNASRDLLADLGSFASSGMIIPDTFMWAVAGLDVALSALRASKSEEEAKLAKALLAALATMREGIEALKQANADASLGRGVPALRAASLLGIAESALRDTLAAELKVTPAQALESLQAYWLALRRCQNFCQASVPPAELERKRVALDNEMTAVQIHLAWLMKRVRAISPSQATP